ncbi:hypothetical protein CEUSTIGMA_g2305.t1 [Chlamydomonas eustigma]|uniref:Peptidase M48 domain-containing protein n=1 Tax=Chlamydomonas eustigma TaxID=1157962 RepID=A0A250WVX5_9CHLO|nr:hypothetical protein CEUSTIGMA_g2305.t1 [Chlamydomonas eustigma]|eukprot:GAX74859.1 hypothetical protein CEUSTIGMA_g2305.t1 [Chlamydomonas eustigma]
MLKECKTGARAIERIAFKHARQSSLRRAYQGTSASPWPSPTTVQRERVTSFEGLRGEHFRHPLDQQNTSMLRSVPGLEPIAKSFLGPAAEQVLLLENIATSIKIGPEQLPSVHKLLLEAAQILEMEAPELYVRQNPIPNAYTLAIAGRQPFIVIHTALLELLTPRELQAVLSHELGHLKCDHGLWLTVANVLASGTVSVLPIVSDFVEEALLRWLRAAELTCDRAALLVAQDPKVVVAALMKLAGGSPSFANELNVDAFLEQARSYDEATNSVLGWYLRNAQTRALSHPLPVMRAREIDRWAQSTEYKGLLSKNRANRVKVVEYLGPAESSMYGLTSTSTSNPQVVVGGPSSSSSVSNSSTLTQGINNVSSSKWGSKPEASNSFSDTSHGKALTAASQAAGLHHRHWLPF